jgi:hypothetical protein
VSLYSAQVGWALLANVFEGHAAEEATQIEQLHQQCRGDESGWALGFGYRCINSADPRPGSGMWPAVNHITLMGLAARLAQGDTVILHGHWLSFIRDLHRDIAVIAVIFCQNDSVAHT